MIQNAVTPSEISPADLAIVKSPAAKARRAQIANYLPLIRPQLEGVAANAPSYVVAEIHGLLNAIDRWTKDEHDHG